VLTSVAYLKSTSCRVESGGLPRSGASASLTPLPAYLPSKCTTQARSALSCQLTTLRVTSTSVSDTLPAVYPPGHQRGRAPVKLGVERKRNRSPDTLCARSGRRVHL